MKSIILTTIIFLSISVSAQKKVKPEICEIKIDGQEYALHLVEVGENLFRIAQSYNSTVEDIWLINPSLIDNTIIPGQVIKVPKNSKVGLSTGAPQKDADAPDYKAPKAPEVRIDPLNVVYHEVEKQQTLFSISRMYNVSIEDLQKWNQLKGYDISIGQKLIVSAHGEIQLIDDKTEEVKYYPPSPTPIKQNISVNANQDVLYEGFLKEKSSGKKANVQRGTAGKLVSNNPNAVDAYYALHKSAPVGSIIKVMNLVNQKYVFVKVLAPLPNIDENNNIEIKVSPAASKDIMLLDGKTLVEITGYY
jgi:LysM repeat protein